jgi:hypothetical protein
MIGKNLLEKRTENFRTSKPVFKINISSNEDEIRFELVDKYRPTPIEGDVLSSLVCFNYEESFNPKLSEESFKFSRNSIVAKSISQIRSELTTLIEKNLPMRNPRQSKLYRWAYRNMPNNDSINDGLILIYQYIRPFCDSNMRISEVQNKPHLENTIALLDALREKHGEE